MRVMGREPFCVCVSVWGERFQIENRGREEGTYASIPDVDFVGVGGGDDVGVLAVPFNLSPTS